MKKLLFILLFLASFNAVYAQQTAPPLTQVEFMKFSDAFVSDPISILKTRIDPKMKFIFGTGEMTTTQQIIDNYTSVFTEKARQISDLSIQQFGNTAIATGHLEQQMQQKKDPTKLNIWKGTFTYAFAYLNNQWIMVGGQHTDYKAPAFTAETLKGILDEYRNDSKAFFNKYLSEDFRYPLPDGKYIGRDVVVGWNKQNILNTEIKDPVIFQSGDLAIVSGVHITEHGVENERAARIEKKAATYTFQRRNGKWLFVASQQSTIQAAVEK